MGLICFLGPAGMPAVQPAGSQRYSRLEADCALGWKPTELFRIDLIDSIVEDQDNRIADGQVFGDIRFVRE